MTPDSPAQLAFDLVASARQTLAANGFTPDIPADAIREAQEVQSHPPGASPEVRDLRQLLWSSIDNDSSRDLDQIEVANARDDGAIQVLIGIADVDAYVPAGSPIDRYAAAEGSTVYTGVRNFPMLPEALSTGMTSLLEGQDRLSLVIDMLIDVQGVIQSRDVYRALVCNHAQLTYNAVGPWLEGNAPLPPKLAASNALVQQLRLQDQAAVALRTARNRHGALNIDSTETEPVMTDGVVTDLKTVHKNRATMLIEDFMIAANSSLAKILSARHISSIRRVVRTPERWNRIVELAAQYGEHLPDTPDSGALNNFLMRRKQIDPLHSPDLSLSVMKLMGPGEYVVEKPGDPEQGHFGLAVQSYTHSTAPNRRYPDLVTQRLLKASLAGQPPPYSDDDLEAIAKACTRKEDASRKVERLMGKRIAAVALSGHIGQHYTAVVTGVKPGATYVRIVEPPVEGRLMRGEQGLDVGDHLTVKLVRADPALGFIDFEKLDS